MGDDTGLFFNLLSLGVTCHPEYITSTDGDGTSSQTLRLGFKCTPFIEGETCTERIRQKRKKKGLNKEVALGMFHPCPGPGRL